MSYLKPFVCISDVGSFPEHCGGSLIMFFVPLGVGKLTLNRQNFLNVVRCRHRFFLAY